MTASRPGDITVLYSVNKLMTKRVRRNRKSGKLITSSYGREKFFRVRTVRLGGFSALAALLARLTGERYAFVVRGEPLAETNRGKARRLLYDDPETGDRATFGEAARHWFAVDLDKIPAPASTDPVNDPHGTIDYLIGLLPPELHDASCWWQFTTSQGLPKTKGTLSARLWFWSRTPADDAGLTRWAVAANTAAGRRIVDRTLYSAVQPHYVANPFFDGLVDPLPLRCGIRRGLDDVWDADIEIVGGQRTVDLRTGEHYAPRKDDYITKSTAVAPARTDTPLWRSFLDKITGGDAELQKYLQRAAGYCLSGITSAHVMFFLYGTGANGKGVFINTLSGIWHDYAAVAPMTIFMASPTDQHPTDLAMLHGGRLVVAQETEVGRHWAEARIKAITGGDPISARFMRADFFTYQPQFKLWIVGNHKPSLRSVDEAIRRRIHLVPFLVTIPVKERDEQLFEKLKPEWPGILQWAVEGHLEWRATGLAPPAAVLDATAQYLSEEDAISRWIEDECVTGNSQWGSSAQLWGRWKSWSEINNEWTGSRKSFGQELEKRGYPQQKSQDMRGFKRIDLRPQFKPKQGNWDEDDDERR